MKLDEVIVLPKYDPENITFEKMQFLQEILKRKSKQEEMRREHQQKQVLHEIKDILWMLLTFKIFMRIHP